MVLTGAIVNALAILLGSVIGLRLSRISDSIKATIMHVMGLAVAILGIQMAISSKHYLVVIVSLVLGALLGEVWHLDDKLNQLGLWIETKVQTKGESPVAEGFVTASLIFVVGAMGILGALDSGIRGNFDVLFTKSVMDGVVAVILTTTLGIGVSFSAVPVLIYEGGIALLATLINQFVPHAYLSTFITEMTAVGGVMIVAIGTNLLDVTRIKVANLLPAIIVVAILVIFI